MSIYIFLTLKFVIIVYFLYVTVSAFLSIDLVPVIVNIMISFNIASDSTRWVKTDRGRRGTEELLVLWGLTG